MSAVLLRPPVGDLIFRLYGRPLHPELFDILAVRKIRREDYELSVWITRTGHVISWENADVYLSEVAAAGDQPLPEKRRLLSWRLRGERSDALACAHHRRVLHVHHPRSARPRGTPGRGELPEGLWRGERLVPAGD